MVGPSAFLVRVGLLIEYSRGAAGLDAVHESLLVEVALMVVAIVAGTPGQFALRTVNRRAYAAVRVRSR